MDWRLLLVVGGIGGAAALQGPIGEANGERRRNDFRYTPRPEVMKVVSGAHRSSVADLLWLRAIPDMARPFDDLEMKRRWLDGVLTVVTDLEPSFTTAYTWGAHYLTLGARRRDGADRALELLQRGIERNPDDVQIRVDTAMVYWTEKKDRKKTLEHLRRAVELPNCDGLTISMLAALQVEEGEDLVALAHWEQMARHPSPQFRLRGERNLEIVKKKIVIRAVKEFEERHGRSPTSRDDLRGPGLIQEQVVDVVVGCVEFAPDGTFSFPRLEALDRRFTIQAVEGWCVLFRRDENRWPTLDEIRANELIRLPDPEPGKRWVFERGRLSEEDE